MKRITDPTFKYVPAAATDIRATFRREQRRLAKIQQLQAKFNVTPIRDGAIRKGAIVK